MTTRLDVLRTRLLSPAALRPYASISEQILMSGSNMLASIVVVAAAGVSAFGLYSFVFVLSTLANGVFSTLLHRQMLLDISAASETERAQVFLATAAVELSFMITAALVAALILVSGSYWWDISEHLGLIVAGGLYMCLYNLFDLCRQYLYTTDNQVYSLRCTVLYILPQMLGLGAIYFLRHDASSVSEVYLLFCLCLVISLASNRRARQVLLSATWTGWRAAFGVFRRFFKQGRFSLIGMLVTWLQNQSMNPFLMLVSGPLLAGYFSLGRLLIMPISVISQGLVNSTTPSLRRIFKRDGPYPLRARINSLIYKTLAVSLAYLALLGVAHVSGLLDHFVPDYEEVQWFLVLWILMVHASTYRFWHGQFFVVSMRFRYLLGVGLVALAVSMSGMVIVGIGLGNVKAALLFVVLGELVTIALFHRERKRVLEDADRQADN